MPYILWGPKNCLGKVPFHHSAHHQWLGDQWGLAPCCTSDYNCRGFTTGVRVLWLAAKFRLCPFLHHRKRGRQAGCAVFPYGVTLSYASSVGGIVNVSTIGREVRLWCMLTPQHSQSFPHQTPVPFFGPPLDEFCWCSSDVWVISVCHFHNVAVAFVVHQLVVWLQQRDSCCTSILGTMPVYLEDKWAIWHSVWCGTKDSTSLKAFIRISSWPPHTFLSFATFQRFYLWRYWTKLIWEVWKILDLEGE